MDTASHTPEIARVSGLSLQAFQQSFLSLNLCLEDKSQSYLEDVQDTGWYPLRLLLRMFRVIRRHYAAPGPIFEQVGIEFITAVYRAGFWQPIFRRGIDFLQAQQDSWLYYQIVQGDGAYLGKIELDHLDAAKGEAVIHSTTPFSRELERGVLLAGLQLTRSYDAVEVDNAQHPDYFQVRCLTASSVTPARRTAMAASDFFAATRLTSDRMLAGPELQKVFWQYKALEKELARQRDYWESTHAALSRTLRQLQDQKRHLQEKNAAVAQAHETSEMLKDGIIDAALDAIITFNEALDIIEFNPSAERIFGYRRSDVLGQPFSTMILPPHLRQRYDEDLQRYLETGQSCLLGQHIELEARHADGRLFPVELALQEVRLAHRRVFTAYLRDITQRERMAQALRESEQRFRSMAEANPVPMGIVGMEDSRWLYVSPSLAQLVGVAVADLLGTPVENLYPDTTARQRFRHKLLNEGGVETHEFALRKSDGSTIPVAVTAKRIVYEGTDAILGGIIDLSERQRAEEEIVRQREALYQNEKLSALGSLLAGVAHELNNPLSVVVGRAIMLEEEMTDPDLRNAVEKMRQAAERCSQIVKTFLAMARQQPPARTPVNLNAAVTTTLDLVGYSLRTAGIDVHLDLAPDLPELSADAVQLQQVVMNLVVNARQALLAASEPRRLEITTRYERRSDLLRIVVTDNGPGVPEAIRSRIFDPFFTTKSMEVGTGVGLSLSHGIVTAHGGTLALEDPPAGGARFVVTLPLIKADPPVSADTPRDDTVAKPHAILIVDDEAELAEMLSDILRRAGHHTTIAASGNAALSQLAAQDYDIILSDVHMPNLNGLDLYRHVQHTYPQLCKRIVFMTGDTLGATVRRFLQETGVPHLEKPLIPREVLQLVQGLLSQ